MWRYNQDKDTFLVLKSSREREIKKIHSSFAEPLKKKKRRGRIQMKYVLSILPTLAIKIVI